jgi:murein tripeptide amidase MpaA
MQIDDHFDSGNIEVIAADDPGNIRLTVRADPPCETPDGTIFYKQWFHFRIAGIRNTPLTIHLEDAPDTSYPKGWEDYRAVYSTDRGFWRRADTTYGDRGLTIRVTPEADVIWVAYFAPYDIGRLQAQIGRWCTHEDVWLRALGRTVDGRPLDRLIVGDRDRERPAIWVVARQHPGETMASWWIEGFVRRLLDDYDGLSVRLRERATFHIVPLMNPDGSMKGYIRTNASGVDLNRVWDDPSAEEAPEVYATLEEMDRTGVALCLDVHGDSDLPYSFAVIPRAAWGQRMESIGRAFCDTYERANPDFQQEHGYPLGDPSSVHMGICKNAIAERFACFAATLEMPFKHNADFRDERQGWSPPRCRRMGASALDGIDAALRVITGED